MLAHLLGGTSISTSCINGPGDAMAERETVFVDHIRLVDKRRRNSFLQMQSQKTKMPQNELADSCPPSVQTPY